MRVSDGNWTNKTVMRAAPLSDIPALEAVGTTITGKLSGATAIIDDTNDSDTVWYHQNTTTGFTPFVAQETVSVVGNASITGVIKTSGGLLQGEADPYSGDLLYIDNRSPVTRSTDQTEDLKIVITI